MENKYRVLQVRATYMHKSPKGVKLDVVVSNVEDFKKQMKALTGATSINLVYELVDNKEYLESEEIVV